MRFGINFVNGGELADPDASTQLAVCADELGFSTIWAADHLVIPVGFGSRYPAAHSGEAPFDHDFPFNEAIVHLAFLASVTRRVRLATGVMVIAQRNAPEVAKAVATLDRLSGGRAVLGLGTGWLREEFDALGARYDDRVSRTEESIEVLRRLWRAPGAEFHGRHFDFGPLTCNPRPCNPDGVPIVIGGYALATARRAARIGNAHYPGPASISDVERFRREIERTAIEHGRDPADIETIVAAPYDGPLDGDLCSRYAAVGVAEMIISVPPVGAGSGDVGGSIRRVLETFRADVIDRIESA
jgi:probable F420-dependent oxidoreductase